MSEMLVLNAGSSSLRCDVFTRWDDDEPERVGHHTIDDVGGDDIPDHAAALDTALGALHARPGLESVEVVAHRVVHGGPFTGPMVVDDDVERAIEDAIVLAPLHNPAALSGVRAARTRWPHAPQVAVFDTSFHQTLSAVAATYALPHELAHRFQVRRWGFHGISHQYVTRRSAEALGVPPADVQLVVCHIGNGVSVTAVRDGRSIDTSMGFTPMEGAVMGTRSGSVDPGVVLHLARHADLSLDQIEDVLLHQSGMVGLCGDGDMRRVRERADGGDERAQFALDVYTHRLRHLVSAYVGQLPTLDAVVFTAGVGEHDPQLRQDVVGPLAHLGLTIDPAANSAASEPEVPVHVGHGRPSVLVVPTDEAAEIVREARSVLGGPVCR